MATRRHASSDGVNWTLVIVPILVAALGVGAFLLLKKGGEGAPGPKETPRVAFAFQEVNTRYYRIEKKPQIDQVEYSFAEINGLMNGFYDAGFVNPDAWQGGTFPDVLGAFAPSAAEQSALDLAALTLGPESAQLKSVSPLENHLQITVLLDREGAPITSVAYAQFSGTGALKTGGELAIAHDASYFLRKVEGAWRIIGYDVDASLDSAGATGGSPMPEETATP